MANSFTRAAIAPFGAITVHRVVSAIYSMADGLRAWNNTRRTIAVLRSLSRSQLEDIGLTPADVEEFGSRRS